jgi:hypothetical protein
MAEENQQEVESPAEGQAAEGGGAAGTAMKAAAAAAATGVAALAAKKAFSARSGSNGQSSNGGAAVQKPSEGPSMLNSVLSGGWEAARDALLPAAEDAASAAGEYVANNGPDILRDRIVPRFIDSFNEARGES